MSECGVVIITVRSFRPRILSFGFGQFLALTFLAPLGTEGANGNAIVQRQSFAERHSWLELTRKTVARVILSGILANKLYATAR